MSVWSVVHHCLLLSSVCSGLIPLTWWTHFSVIEIISCPNFSSVRLLLPPLSYLLNSPLSVLSPGFKPSPPLRFSSFPLSDQPVSVAQVLTFLSSPASPSSANFCTVLLLLLTPSCSGSVTEVLMQPEVMFEKNVWIIRKNKKRLCKKRCQIPVDWLIV